MLLPEDLFGNIILLLQFLHCTNILTTANYYSFCHVCILYYRRYYCPYSQKQVASQCPSLSLFLYFIIVPYMLPPPFLHSRFLLPLSPVQSRTSFPFSPTFSLSHSPSSPTPHFTPPSPLALPSHIPYSHPFRSPPCLASLPLPLLHSSTLHGHHHINYEVHSCIIILLFLFT